MDEFLEANPERERADQAKLLKAEGFIKRRISRTPPRSMRNCVLPSCRRSCAPNRLTSLAGAMCRSSDRSRAIDAFAYFLKAFPGNPQTPSALAQRALAYQETKQLPARPERSRAIAPELSQAREREAALQQKALILGQQDNAKGMTATFQQLLKEFPKTAVAAQANYYIGKSAFEAKDYKTAMAALNTARQGNKEQY